MFLQRQQNEIISLQRMARNPATGEQIKKDADRVVKVTVAKALDNSINA
jgi:DNA-binding protein HU-beta